MKFSKELIESGREIINDKSLDDYQKCNELEEMLLDEGFELDCLFDFILALN